EGRVDHTERHGCERHPYETAVWPVAITEHEESRQCRGQRDDDVADSAVNDGKGLLPCRPAGPNCVKRKMQDFPSEVANRDHAQIDTQSAQPIRLPNAHRRSPLIYLKKTYLISAATANTSRTITRR